MHLNICLVNKEAAAPTATPGLFDRFPSRQILVLMEDRVPDLKLDA